MATVRKNNPHRYWFIDGVSCLGKTSFIMRHEITAEFSQERKDEPELVDEPRRRIVGLPLDYAERVKRNGFFVEKHSSMTTQILYTASFGLAFQAALERLKNDEILMVDRSPISDLWYELLFKSYDDEASYEQVFDRIETLDMFDRIPTIFIIPDVVHAPRIKQQMGIRQNGIDSIDEQYIIKQIHVFNKVVQRFGQHANIRVIRIEPNMPIYSNVYFAWLRDEIHKCLRDE